VSIEQAVALGGFNSDDAVTMHVWNTKVLAAQVMFNHIHYLDTSGTSMVEGYVNPDTCTTIDSQSN